MAIGRDWRKTLFPASYKGVPFQTERDEESGSRRVVMHEFPMRDTGYNEDLGEGKREFDVTAYVASDKVETEAADLTAVFMQRGPGILVLPSHGPLLVRYLTHRRAREKDQAGKIAISVRFVREGESVAVVSFAFLANNVFVRGDAITASVASFAVSAMQSYRQPDFVREAITEAVEDGLAILDMVRKSTPVDPVVSAAQRDEIQKLFDGAPTIAPRSGYVDGEAIAKMVSIARAIGAGMSGESAVFEFSSVVSQATASPPAMIFSKSGKTAFENKRAAYIAVRVALLTAYVEGIVRSSIGDRQTAIRLRADTAEYFDDLLGELSAHDGDFYRAAVDIRNAAIDYLSRTILDRAPVIEVGSNRSMPSLWWACRLYNDPNRVGEIVGRNRVAHPSFMPQDFEALSK